MYMKIHCTFSLSSDVVLILEKCKNKSLYIEDLIKKDMKIEKQQTNDTNNIEEEINRLIQEKEKIINDEKARAKKIQEENLLINYKKRREEYFMNISDEERKNMYKLISNGVYENMSEYYTEEIEGLPC